VINIKENISISMKESERIAIMDNLIAKRIKQKHASRQLGISIRQVQRIMKKYKRDGIAALAHQGRGRVGNRALEQDKKDAIITLVKKHYPDFGPTFASENLAERDGIVVSKETLRQIMIEEDLWKAKQRKEVVIHTFRERRPCVGELVQLDGSPHAWFEDRAEKCTLIAFIDDATSRIMDGEFADYEGTFTLFDATEHYLKTYGKPLSLYVDKHSTFRINRQATIEEELKDTRERSQYGRAMDDLGIELIFAHSPEAKGRVERMFKTLQDRLVKELRLAGISTKDEATKYFREVYMPRHNARFAVAPKENKNMHKELLDDLSRIFTVQTKRIVSKTLVVQYKNTRYQIDTKGAYQYLLRKQSIIVEENRQGALIFRHKDKILSYKDIGQIIKNPKVMQVASAKSFQERQVIIQRKDPWAEPIITPTAL
jgi:transposase/citrate lyase gamma subunit